MYFLKGIRNRATRRPRKRCHWMVCQERGCIGPRGIRSDIRERCSPPFIFVFCLIHPSQVHSPTASVICTSKRTKRAFHPAQFLGAHFHFSTLMKMLVDRRQ